MKRLMLLLGAIAFLLLVWADAVGAAVQGPPIKLEDFVQNPEYDSTFTIINIGDRTEILPKERVYLADADTFDFSGIGEGATVLMADGAAIRQADFLAEFRCGGPNRLTQIIGRGADHGTTGIIITGHAVVENTVMDGHEVDLLMRYPDKSKTMGRPRTINVDIKNIYSTNSEYGIAVWNESIFDEEQFLSENEYMWIRVYDSWFWNNTFLDVRLNPTDRHANFRAVNSAFLTVFKNSKTGAFQLGFDWDENRLKYTAEFLDCVFSKAPKWWEDPNWGHDGTVVAKTTMPGGAVIQDYPPGVQVARGDFNASGIVGLEDFRFMTADYGTDATQTRYGWLYDMDRNSVVDWEDAKLFVRELGILPDQISLANIPELVKRDDVSQFLEIVVEFDAIQEDALADPEFRPLVEEFLNPTAVLNIEAGKPTRFVLHQNYPNPFNSETIIRFELAEDSQVQLAMYNVAGQMVRMLEHGFMNAGVWSASWDGRDDSGNDASSGVYLYRLMTGSGSLVRTLTLVR